MIISLLRTPFSPGGSISRLAAAVTALAVIPATVMLGTGTATAGEDSTSNAPGTAIPGTAPSTAPPSGSRLTAAEEEVFGGLQMVVNERGRISRSIAAVGTYPYETVPLRIEKPNGATVRKAYLAFTTTGYTYQPMLQAPELEGQSVPLEMETPSPMGAFNYFADVTEHVRDKVDAAPAGTVDVMLTEMDYYHEGTVLVVIFNDPNVHEAQSVTMLFGAINPAGDTYGVTLTEPIDKSDADTHMDMSLGISYGWQEYGDQYSTIDVNGSRLTTSAGGSDDGGLSNGSLITAGGVGDSLDNPADPYALPVSGSRSDDELYDLLPFVDDGDTTVQVVTDNPSNDDNVFLATLTMNPPVRSVTTDGDTLPVTPELQGVPVGLDAHWTATHPDGAILGPFAPWKAEITAGPNVGRDFAFGCDPFGCIGSIGNDVPLYLRPLEPFEEGTDLVKVWYDDDDDDVLDADELFADVGVRWLDPANQVAMGDSYSSGEGVDPYDSGTDDDWGDNRNQCHRSADAWGRHVQPSGYPNRLLDYVDTLGTSVDLIACSGATTRNVVTDGREQYPGEGGTQVNQGKLSTATDLVTISIGGNDVGFSNIVTACARNGCDDGKVDGQPVYDYADDTLAALPDRLDEALSQIKAHAPNATVLLLGYPRLFSDTAEERDTCPMISELWDVDSQEWMNSKAYEVSNVMSEAADRNGVWYLSPIGTFDNHEICGSEGEWIEGVKAPNLPDLFHKDIVGTGSFHPNNLGHLDGYAALVNDFLAQAAADGLPTNAAGLPLNPTPTQRVARRAAAEAATASLEPVTSVGSLEVTQVPGAAETACYPEGLVGASRPTRLWGAGFAAGTPVEAVWGREDGTETVLGTVTASAAGQVATTVTTPAAELDSYARLYLRGAADVGGRRELSALVGVARSCPVTTYEFDGFYAPVNNLPVVNTTNAGRAVPVKFSLGGDHGLDILASGSPSSRAVDCASGAAVDAVEETVTPGQSSLTYDAGADRYQYVWKTSREWAGTCRELALTLDDGSTHRAMFALR